MEDNAKAEPPPASEVPPVAAVVSPAACSKACGRPASQGFPTCCRTCTGPGGLHGPRCECMHGPPEKAGPPPASEEDKICSLKDLGFSEEHALEALKSCNWSVEAAAAALFESQEAPGDRGATAGDGEFDDIEALLRAKGKGKGKTKDEMRVMYAEILLEKGKGKGKSKGELVDILREMDSDDEGDEIKAEDVSAAGTFWISGCGENRVNGTYTCTRKRNGRPQYNKDGDKEVLFYFNCKAGEWRLFIEDYKDSETLYKSTSDEMTLPSRGWVVDNGASPPPRPLREDTPAPSVVTGPSETGLDSRREAREAAMKRLQEQQNKTVAEDAAKKRADREAALQKMEARKAAAEETQAAAKRQADAEAARAEEQRRAEAEAAQKRLEDQRRAQEQRAAEEKAAAEEARKKADDQRRAAEAKKAEEQKASEEARKEEDEQRRRVDERKAAEEKMKSEQELRIAAEPADEEEDEDLSAAIAASLTFANVQASRAPAQPTLQREISNSSDASIDPEILAQAIKLSQEAPSGPLGPAVGSADVDDEDDEIAAAIRLSLEA